ncbi:MAG: pyridoxal phosphate-dependent aminotransferase [Methylococcales bacterium]|nr:pyridoxal phosphate-dependent aminotransferase [Methylococcales bacterium]MBT3698500.1 pyridoxal phosphate-dependent aminotransferase [Methylococcales bacterium]MBT4598719.1 pyridoxal phosphate-dependent aminotransferase [Methylococcales bacterium]MBT7109121.1 pyridoxal phosphate-dependent aminotransferase [Methylococcales bacterium]MBT7968409.1 pyridoxal phosphate-dependent aminotransferase [Methylococcales bacterium]
MIVLVSDKMKNITPFHVMALLERAKELEKQGRNVIHMEVGEPDFPTPEPIVTAGMNAIRQGDVKYTPAAGLPELRERIAYFYQQRYGVTVAAERVLVTPGASGALLLALGVSLNSGQSLLMADPSYPCNRNFMAFLGAQAQLIPVRGETNFQLTAQLIEQNWQQNTRGVLVASPSNPTGTLISKQALNECIDITEKKKGCFYSDEIYHGLVYQGEAQTALAYNDDVFVINSFSKYFGMTGWRVGWLIVPACFYGAAEKLAQNLFIAAASHSQYAALAALDNQSMIILEARRFEFQRRGDFLYEQLIRLGFVIMCRPQGAFYIYADCSALTDNSFQFVQELLEVEGVAITPGCDFGDSNANSFVRFSYTSDLEHLNEAIFRIERFLKNK